MLKTVKYTSNFPVEEKCSCTEKLPGCEGTAAYHVCFEDGSGKSVCRNCFDKRVNSGEWETDSAERLAS
ncbi:MAG: hypothetical protein C4534_09920 [Gaiellales bacterium]|nr:MAG: hypothetical protein C4534_09920 [Gaiellales bacterium]